VQRGAKVQVLASGALHAAAFQEEILANLKFVRGVVIAFGIHGEAVLIGDVCAGGVALRLLILASLGEADLALEENVVALLLRSLLHKHLRELPPRQRRLISELAAFPRRCDSCSHMLKHKIKII
jgi:hypothetical protein